MDYTTFGRTGLRVSVAGLGCGGFSRLGLATGHGEAEAVALVHAALDQGVNFLDTARSYGTEEVVGQALRSVPRDSVVLATKSYIHKGQELLTPANLRADLEASLRALGTDTIDIYQVHAPPAHVLKHIVDMALPEMVRFREEGKIRHIGIAGIAADHHHEVLLALAGRDEVESLLVAFHMLHQTARDALLKRAVERDLGIDIMYAVRNMFARPDVLKATFADLARRGLVPAEMAAREQPLDILLHEGGAATLTEAAYRFVRHEPGVHVVLFGTGERAHLAQNIAAILRPPLPARDVERLHRLFGRLTGVGLERPPWRMPQDGRAAPFPSGN